VQFIEGLMARFGLWLPDGTLDIGSVAVDVCESHDDEFALKRILQARQRIVVRAGPSGAGQADGARARGGRMGGDEARERGLSTQAHATSPRV
jgi:hypothetical protein